MTYQHPVRTRTRSLGWMLGLVGLVTAPWQAQAQDPPEIPGALTQNESHKLIRANDVVGSLGTDLFGEEVNLYTGALAFSVVDVSLPGNDALPMQIGRRFTVEAVGPKRSYPAYFKGLFGDWELDLPMIHGVFADTQGFVSNTIPGARCSAFSPPPNGDGTGGVGFQAEEFWSGTSLYIPGFGEQEILKRALGNNAAPNNQPNDWPLVTRNHWQINCDSAPILGGGTGEGFLVRSPTGIGPPRNP
jgi:hypothetical protein